ncbi:MAG: carbon-nitrogen hydrolase family protein [Hyphomicrobiales bacterium]
MSNKKNKFKAACLQMTTGCDLDESISFLREKLTLAKEMGADVVVTPEQTLLMEKNSKTLFSKISYPDDDQGLKKLQSLIRELELIVIVGSISIKYSDNLAYNRTYAFDANGEIIGTYDKIHMFDVELSTKERYFESNTFKSGDKLSIIDLPWCKFGLSICYDLRFPSLYRNLAQKGASVIIVPSAFTVKTGRAHWETLLRARAIETGCFIIAPAQVGKHQNGRETYGNSMIISPWGEILSHVKDDNYIGIAEINLQEVESYRKMIPSINQNYDYN